VLGTLCQHHETRLLQDRTYSCRLLHSGRGPSRYTLSVCPAGNAIIFGIPTHRSRFVGASLGYQAQGRSELAMYMWICRSCFVVEVEQSLRNSCYGRKTCRGLVLSKVGIILTWSYESSRKRKWHKEEGGLGGRAMNLSKSQHPWPLSIIK